MKRIPLTKGFEALVDDEDHDALSQHKWCASRTGRGWYAVRHDRTERRIRRGRRVKREINRYMHHEIMGRRLGMDIDHADGNGLNNQRSNLRWATRSQNLA